MTSQDVSLQLEVLKVRSANDEIKAMVEELEQYFLDEHIDLQAILKALLHIHFKDLMTPNYSYGTVVMVGNGISCVKESNEDNRKKSIVNSFKEIVKLYQCKCKEVKEEGIGCENG